jgi:RNA polymerase sigma factor (sigma-70 family)
MMANDFSERDMSTSRIHHLIRHLRRMAGPAEGPGLTDVQLLERFAFAGDEAAFELLAWRHGPMVLRVCRRVLGDAHEAEDAFQATFLVLAQKAASAARHKSAGGWLYTVAYRVALRARAHRATRNVRERPFDDAVLAAARDPASEAAGREARLVIDEEVSRLPLKYRVPFVLYYLEGRSNAEVARELGCPVGTVESWLTRARARLRTALSRRGLTPATALFASLAPQEGWLPQAAQAAQAALAAGRGVAGAVSAEAASLAAEVLSAFGILKAKVAVMVLLLAIAAAGAVGLAVGSYQRAGPPVRTSDTPVPPDAPAAAQTGKARSDVPAKAALPVERGTVRGILGGLNAVALSPDGMVLASGSNDGSVKVWDTATGMEKFSLSGHTIFIYSVAFSPDGKTLASGSNDKTVILWDATTGKEKVTLRGHTGFIYSVAFSPDGKVLASAGGVQPAAFKSFKSFDQIPKDDLLFKEIGEVKVWDLATLKERTLYHGDTGRVTSIAFSPDGKTLASGGRDGAIQFWDVATGKECACIRENFSVGAVAFSSDGNTLAAVDLGQAGLVKLWDLATGGVRARLKGHRGPVHGVAFTMDGKTLATAGNVPSPEPRKPYDATGEVRLWDAATGQQRGAPLTFPHYASCLALSARGTILAAGGPRGSQHNLGQGAGEITIWDLGLQADKGGQVRF